MILDYLTQYRASFISIGLNPQQRKFLNESFIRWYMNCEKIGIDKIAPARNIFSEENYIDIVYANINRNTNFDIAYIINKSFVCYVQFFELCKDILNTSTDNDTYWVKMSKLLTKSQERRLKSLYIGSQNKFTQNIEKLTALYEFVGMDNTNHLSIPPVFDGVELFGSCINTHNKDFCSLFETEKLFGSLGSFFDYKFHKDGLYLCNPPFDVTLIKKMSRKLLHELMTTDHDIIIICTIPVWDSTSQQMLNIKDFNIEFEGYENLVNNSFLREKMILDKSIYKYWNYCTEKLMAVSHTHLIILSNMSYQNYKAKFDLDDFTKLWRDF